MEKVFAGTFFVPSCLPRIPIGQDNFCYINAQSHPMGMIYLIQISVVASS